MKIVCFHLNQVGDLIFSLPALQCLRDSFPDARITCVARPSAKEVLETTGIVDEVLSRRGGVSLSKYTLARRLASLRPDLAIVFSQSAECAALAYLSKAPTRIGFINTSAGVLLTQRVDFQHPPSTQNNLRLVKAAGCEISKRDYVGLLRPSAAQMERAGRLLASCGVESNDPVVALAPGTSGRRSVKEWTDEGFAAVGDHLIGSGFRVVILGTEPVPDIVERCKDIIDLSGRTDLGQAIAILDRCKLLVAVDSGILHLCAAAGTPVIGLYGPSDPLTTGPQGSGHIVLTSRADCSPCFQTECDRARKCMVELKPEHVIAAAQSVLAPEKQVL